MNDLITAATSGLFVEVGKVIEHMKAQQARIADLERQLAEASAPAVDQQPFGYFREMLNHEGKGNGVYLGVTEKKVSEQGHIPGETSETMIELYAAPQAAPAVEQQPVAQMICPTCGKDRFKEPCPNMADECSMIADAHLLAAPQAADTDKVREAMTRIANELEGAAGAYSGDFPDEIARCVEELRNAASTIGGVK